MSANLKKKKKFQNLFPYKVSLDCFRKFEMQPQTTYNNESLNEKYLITDKILGEGSFGTVFLGYKKEDMEEVAIKFETNTFRHDNSDLEREMQIYQEIHKNKNAQEKGIPQVYDFIQKKKGNYLVMELLGQNLEELVLECGGTFSMKTTLQLGLQMLEILEFIHRCKYVFLDVKPQNFLFGKGRNSRKLFIVDFGLAKKYISENGLHLPFNENYGLRGTRIYASDNIHFCQESARRDDLISLGYVLRRFLKGSLPWDNIPIPKKYSKEWEKSKIDIETLVMKLKEIEHKNWAPDLPKEFAIYMEYTIKLPFLKEPDHQFLKDLLEDLFQKSGWKKDDQFDWMS